ncbi:MAG TPA: bifunctional ADP-dependent NAD(P)H-hydrate dehydratase/NAD(P)H-hydrate epimerase, partial [Pantoea agglomerans]|nr:bifunctional ADP-dependent NAD(P)H-hydrate dehydratase/NAD(P)H-hydrate epimerase [Pantoea agglomerans]
MSNQDSKKNSRSLPYSVWPAQAVAQLEQQGADALGITLYELMLRAGQAAYEHLTAHWPEASHWLILRGHGSNGGDGYVLARLGQAAGKTVTLLAGGSKKALPGEARRARDARLEGGGEIHAAGAVWPGPIEVIV